VPPAADIGRVSWPAAGAVVAAEVSRIDVEALIDTGLCAPDSALSTGGVAKRPEVGDGYSERHGGVRGGSDACVSLAVLADALGVAVDAVFVGAVGAEVFAGDVDGVAVDGAGVADVGLLLGLGPVAGEGGGPAHGRPLGGEGVHRIVQADRGGAFAGGVLGAQLGVVDLDEPGFGARLAEREGERVAFGVD